MAVDGKAFTVNCAAVQLRDNTPTTPIALTLTNDTSVGLDGFDGRFMNSTAHFQRRGKHFSSAHTERIYPTVTIEFIHDGFVGDGSAPGTPIEFATFQGTYSANVSTVDNGSRGVKSIDIILQLEGTDYGGTDQTVTLHDCVLRGMPLYADGEPSTYSMTFDVTGEVDGDLSFVEAPS